MKLQFTGTYYHGGQYRFTEAGNYEVDEAKAKQLLTDFPERFTAAGAIQKPSDDASGTKHLSKMNRDELETVAAKIGLKVSDDLDTNAKLRAAIEQHQDEAK